MLMHAEGSDKPEFLERYFRRVGCDQQGILTDIRDSYTSQNLEKLRIKVEEKHRKSPPHLAVASNCIGETDFESDSVLLVYTVTLYRRKRRYHR